MPEVSPDQLKQAVESQHGGTATFVQSVPVREQFRGEIAFSGNVAIFDLKDSPSGATRAYAWEQDRQDGKKRYAAVLHLGGITGPVEAVRAAIVAEARAGAPRSLTAQQKQAFVTALKGKISRIDFVVQRDVESGWYALQIQSAAQEAGAIIGIVDMPPGETLIVPTPGGLIMYSPKVRAAGEQQLAGDPLYEALKAAGLYGGATSSPRISGFGLSAELPKYDARLANEYVLYVGQKMP